jgi:hypothetical protein
MALLSIPYDNGILKLSPLVTLGGQTMMDSSFSSFSNSEDGDEEEEDGTDCSSRNSWFGPRFATEDDIQDAKPTMKMHPFRAMGTMI